MTGIEERHRSTRILLCLVFFCLSGSFAGVSFLLDKVPRLARPFGGGDFFVGPEEGPLFWTSVAICVCGMVAFGAQLMLDVRLYLKEGLNRPNARDS